MGKGPFLMSERVMKAAVSTRDQETENEVVYWYHVILPRIQSLQDLFSSDLCVSHLNISGSKLVSGFATSLPGKHKLPLQIRPDHQDQ